MKKILCIMLALLMLSGCSGSGEKKNDSAEPENERKGQR